MRAGRDFYCLKSVVSPVFPSLRSVHAGQYQGLLGEAAANITVHRKLMELKTNVLMNISK